MMTSDEIARGGVLNGQPVDPVTLLFHALQARFGALRFNDPVASRSRGWMQRARLESLPVCLLGDSHMHNLANTLKESRCTPWLFHFYHNGYVLGLLSFVRASVKAE